jgi:hypothetical protein
MKAILKDFSCKTFLQLKVAEELTLLHTGRAFVTFEYSLTKKPWIYPAYGHCPQKGGVSEFFSMLW